MSMQLPTNQDLQNLKILAEHHIKTRVNFETGNLEAYDHVTDKLGNPVGWWIEVQGWSLEKLKRWLGY